VSGTPVVPSGCPEIVGTIDELGVMEAPGVLPRRVFVWRPPGYEPGRAHPVLYMHDGHNLVDPATSYAGADWQVDEVAATLIASGRIEPLLIVGAECSDDRMLEYGIGPRGEAYLRWLAEDLKPLVDARYPTRPGREDTAVCGSSMGGLISLLAVLDRGEVFGAAAGLSSWLPPQAVVRAGIAPLFPGTRIYLDNGTEGLDAGFQPGLDRMAAVLEERGLVPGSDLEVRVLAGAGHHENDWSARVWIPLEFLFGTGAA
jgi:enterochelin esterase-like enzyme